MRKMPALFVGHGSPMIALEDSELTRTMSKIGNDIIAKYGIPKGIIISSAHWQTKRVSTSSSEKPKQIYDMYGFPKALYELKYSASGSSNAANSITSILGNEITIDNTFGIDHGIWSVLVHMFPKADIPVIPISVPTRISPESYYSLGEKIASLRSEGYLIMGTGNIVHNLYLVDWNATSPAKDSLVFDKYVYDNTLLREDANLINYTKNQASSLAVPTIDHYFPFLFVLGASRGEKPTVFNKEVVLSTISMTSYLFEEEA